MSSVPLLLSLTLASSVYAASVPVLSLLAFLQLTHPQCLEWGRRPSQWPFGKDLGGRCRSIPRCVTHLLPCPLSSPHLSPTPALLLFGAALTIIIVTLRQRRRKRQQAQRPDYAYASNPPPAFLPSIPYGISRVRQSDDPPNVPRH